MGNRELAQRI